MRLGTVLVAALAVLTAGCVDRADVPSGAAAYDIMPPPAGPYVLREYRINPGDQLSVMVYREPELSLPQVQVDTAGRFAIPLLGSVEAAGKTADELALDIQNQLGQKYLQSPSVIVNISSAALQRVIVDGSVSAPGIYEIRGQTTLLGALALARGPNQVAALDEIAVFRRVNGELVAAKFNVRDIRKGDAPDPEILPNDTVVVGFSGLKQAWRDFLQAVPVFSLFYRVSQ